MAKLNVVELVVRNVSHFINIDELQMASIKYDELDVYQTKIVLDYKTKTHVIKYKDLGFYEAKELVENLYKTIKEKFKNDEECDWYMGEHFITSLIQSPFIINVREFIHVAFHSELPSKTDLDIINKEVARYVELENKHRYMTFKELYLTKHNYYKFYTFYANKDF